MQGFLRIEFIIDVIRVFFFNWPVLFFNVPATLWPQLATTPKCLFPSRFPAAPRSGCAGFRMRYSATPCFFLTRQREHLYPLPYDPFAFCADHAQPLLSNFHAQVATVKRPAKPLNKKPLHLFPSLHSLHLKRRSPNRACSGCGAPESNVKNPNEKPYRFIRKHNDCIAGLAHYWAHFSAASRCFRTLTRCAIRWSGNSNATRPPSEGMKSAHSSIGSALITFFAFSHFNTS
jgi:hypothetical protein